MPVRVNVSILALLLLFFIQFRLGGGQQLFEAGRSSVTVDAARV